MEQPLLKWNNRYIVKIDADNDQSYFLTTVPKLGVPTDYGTVHCLLFRVCPGTFPTLNVTAPSTITKMAGLMRFADKNQRDRNRKASLQIKLSLAASVPNVTIINIKYLIFFDVMLDYHWPIEVLNSFNKFTSIHCLP